MIAVVILVIFLFYHFRMPVKFKLKTFQIPGDVEQYIIQSEQRFSDIIPGAEKKIYWADKIRKHKTEIAIIYLHGFSASRQEVAPLCDILAERLAANLFYTRLTGHGRNGDAMGEATVNCWMNDVCEAVAIGRQIGKKVLVVGTSTGATLATWLASHDPSEDILAYILISPNFGPKNRLTTILNMPGAKYVVPYIFGKYRSWKPRNRQQARYWTTRYPIIAVFPVLQLVRLVRKTALNQILHPFLFIYSRKDQIVDAHKTEKIYARLGAPQKRQYYIEKSKDAKNHLIVGNILSPDNNEEVAGIILKYLRTYVL